MGRFRYIDFIESSFEAVPYRINVFHDEETGLSKQDIDSILNSLKRYRKRYSFCSYLLVESTTDKKCNRQKFKTGKPGRPKDVPVGKKVPRHAHIVIIGDAQHSAYSYGKKVKRAIGKRLNKNGLKGKRTKLESFSSKEHAINSINYDIKQADNKWTAGDFDFNKFKNYQNLSA